MSRMIYFFCFPESSIAGRKWAGFSARVVVPCDRPRPPTCARRPPPETAGGSGRGGPDHLVPVTLATAPHLSNPSHCLRNRPVLCPLAHPALPQRPPPRRDGRTSVGCCDPQVHAAVPVFQGAKTKPGGRAGGADAEAGGDTRGSRTPKSQGRQRRANPGRGPQEAKSFWVGERNPGTETRFRERTRPRPTR